MTTTNLLIRLSKIRGFWRLQPALRKLGVPVSWLWKLGIPAQISSWRKWLQRGLDGKLDAYNFRCDPDAPVQDYLTALLSQNPRDNYRILDIGAGPLTSIGKAMDNVNIEIVAIDPLAEEYQIMLDELNIHPPVTTVIGDAEKVDHYFPPESFDLICADNSLDHCYQPIEAIDSMLRILRPSGHIFLQHYVNEGIAEDYDGFHQWNFDQVDGHFCINNGKSNEIDISKRYEGSAETICKHVTLLERDWLRVVIRKLP